MEDLQSKILHPVSTRNSVLAPKLACCINYYNSLFLASSHNFISPHFCIKYLKMPTMIPVQVTQTQEENDNPTMALPFLDTFLVPHIPEKKMTQKTLLEFGKKSGPTHEFRPVNEHVRGENTFVKTHMRKMRIRKKGDKKESKTNNSNKKTGKAKHGAFPKLEDNYNNKGDAQEARSMYLEQFRELARGSKK